MILRDIVSVLTCKIVF